MWVYSLSLFFPLCLCLALPPHTYTHVHTQWDKSWGNWCPCFVGPPVHPGYKSKNPVRVNPLCGREPGLCLHVCMCAKLLYTCVCVWVCWHRPVWNVPHEWQTGSGCPAGRELSPLLDHLPTTHRKDTPNPTHIPLGASFLPFSHLKLKDLSMFYVANNILSLCLITLNLLRPSCSFSNANRSTQYCLLVSHLALITVLNQSYLKKKK